MPHIIATETALYWSVWDDTGVLANGVTPVGALTVTGKNITYGKTENEFLSAAVVRKEKYPPLPAAGTWLEAGDVYAYGNTLVMVRQSHARTEHDPLSTLSLFLAYRPDAAGVLEWIAGEKVDVGTLRTYGGITYRCLQAHVTQSDWTPDKAPALWIRADTTVVPGSEWRVGVTYNANDEALYQGQRYRCLQRHVSIDAWTPDKTLGVLWAAVATTPEWQPGVRYTGDNTAGSGNGDVVTYQGRRYRCWQTHTSQIGWEPPNVPALWIDLGPV